MAIKPKTFCGDLTQPLKYFVINCGTNNLDTENPDEISDRLIFIALFLQKRMKHLQIVVDGLIPHDAINTKQTETVRSKPIITRQIDELQQILLPKTRHRMEKTKWWAQQNLLLQRKSPSPRKRKQKFGPIN